MSFIGRSIGRVETKVLDASALRSVLFGGISKAGVAVNVQSALKVTAVLACVRVISEGIAQLPLKFKQKNSIGRKRDATEHPLYNILWRKPNDFQTSFEWRESMLVHALLTPGAFSIISRNSQGEVLELLPVQPGRVNVVQAPNYDVTYEISDSSGRVKTFDKKDILHLKGPSWDGFNGLDPMRLGLGSIGLSIATEESMERLFANGSRPSGILSTKGKLQPDEKERVKKNFQDGYASIQNLFKTILLDGDWAYQQMSLSPVDSQTHESRKHQIEEVCRLFRVFPQMIGYGDKTSTYASAEQFFMAHVTHTLMPWIERFEQVLATQLMTKEEVAAGFFPKFNVGGLLRGDAKSRAEYYASGITTGGWLVRNEARDLEDLDPLPGLDEPLVPMNMQTTAQQKAAALAATKAPAADPNPVIPDGSDAKSIAFMARALAEEMDELGMSNTEEKIGRVLSLRNENKLKQARDLVNEVLQQVDAQAAA